MHSRIAFPTPGATVLITGAGGGLGRQLAKAYAARGARVALVDVDGGALAETAAHLGDDWCAGEWRIDLGDGLTAHAQIIDLLDSLPDVELVIACAGIARGSSIGEEGNFAETMAMIDVNTIGAIATIDATIAYYRRLAVRGRLAVIGSLGGLRGLPGSGYAGYGASKAAIAVYMESLRGELRRAGLSRSILTTLVLPGHFGSRMAVPSDKFVIPLDTITADVMDAIDRGRPVHVATGPIWRLQALALRVIPSRLLYLAPVGAD